MLTVAGRSIPKGNCLHLLTGYKVGEQICRIAILGLACLICTAATAGELTFEDRVKAQDAIERVYTPPGTGLGV